MAGQTIDNPVILSRVLTSDYVRPGDIIHLRGGTYTGDFSCALNGTADLPITIQAYQNERPIIDGSLSLNGSYQLWKNIEVMHSGWTTRTSAQSGVPTDIPYKEFQVRGSNHVLSGMIIHDISDWNAFELAIGTKITGCLSYNIGWIGSDRSHGHGLYIKNGDVIKTIKRTVAINSFRHAFNCFAEGLTRADNIDLIENCCINPGRPAEASPPNMKMILGGISMIYNARWYRNMLYNCVGDVGYASGSVDTTRVDNYMIDDCAVNGTVNFIEDSGNTFERPESGQVQFCYVNEYTDTKGILVMYNWDLSDSMVADLTAITGLSVGDTARLRCAENYNDCYQDLVLDASKQVTVDMRAISHSVATAIGHTHTPDTTFPEFGAFMIEKI